MQAIIEESPFRNSRPKTDEFDKLFREFGVASDEGIYRSLWNACAKAEEDPSDAKKRAVLNNIEGVELEARALLDLAKALRARYGA